MSTTIVSLLYPTLKAAHLVGLIPCSRLRGTDRLQRSHVFFLLNRAFSLIFLYPMAIYYMFIKIFDIDSVGTKSGVIFFVCFMLSSLTMITFLVIYSWYFTAKSCPLVTKIFKAFILSKKIVELELQKWKRALHVYQISGLVISLSICMTLTTGFSIFGQSNWRIQVFLNFIRLQMYVIEQLIVTCSILFAIFYREFCKNLCSHYSSKGLKTVSICLKRF